MTTEPLPSIGASGNGGGASPGGNRRLVIILSVIGGVLLLAVVALTFLLLGRSLGGEDTANPTPAPTAVTPSPTPTPTPSATEAPPPEVDASPRFTEFDAKTEVRCPKSGNKPEIEFSWATENAVEVWYTAGDDDAIDDGYMQVPLSGDQDDLTDEHLFPCAHRETQDYTLTLLGPDGEHVSGTWTVVDLNWGKGGNDDDED